METTLRLSTTVTVGLLAVAVNRVVERSDTRAATARGIAEAVQLAVLPAPPDRIGDLRIAARYETAHLDTRIGGDLYCVQRTPYGIRALVGDVRGSGLGAVTVVTVVLGAFREAAGTEPELSDVADRVERSLERERERGLWRDDEGNREGFVTAVLVEVSEGDGPREVRVVNRGHPPPLLLPPGGGSVRALEPDAYGLPLGLGRLGDGTGGSVAVAPFPPGALLLVHTDGLTEARDAAGAFYDPVPWLRGRRFPGPDALLDGLLAEVHAHTAGGQDDDMALLAVMRDPDPPPTG
nr:PP2C family protein-serine/threonine phosphatase [Streptomyces taklimakanensis]